MGMLVGLSVLLSIKIISSQVQCYYDWLKRSTGSGDNSIRKWNLNEECILTNAHDDEVLDLMIYNGELFSASVDKTIKQWTLDGSLKRVYKGHTHVVSCVSIWRGALFSCGYDNTIIQWTSKYKYY